MDKIIVRRKRRIEKMKVTMFERKELISLRLMPRLAKNFTSSIVFAFSTTKVIKVPPSTKQTKRIAARNQNITEGEVF